VNANEIDVAAITRGEEVAEPIETHAAVTVGHGGGSKVHLLLQGFGRLHVRFPGGHGGGDGHAGAAGALSVDVLVERAHQERMVKSLDVWT
jgi:hypothetical protein